MVGKSMQVQENQVRIAHLDNVAYETINDVTVCVSIFFASNDSELLHHHPSTPPPPQMQQKIIIEKKYTPDTTSSF